MNILNMQKFLIIMLASTGLLLTPNFASAHNHAHGSRQNQYNNVIKKHPRPSHQNNRREYRVARGHTARPIVRDAYPHTYYNNRYVNYYAPQQRIGLHDIVLDIFFLH